MTESASDGRLEDLRQRWEQDRSSRVFVQLAEEYRRHQHFDEAINVLRQGLEHHPNSLSARVALGRCQFEAGAYDRASEELERVVSQDPTQMVAYKLLVRAYLKRERPKEAKERLDRYALLNATDPEIKELEGQIAGLHSGIVAPSTPEESSWKFPSLEESHGTGVEQASDSERTEELLFELEPGGRVAPDLWQLSPRPLRLQRRAQITGLVSSGSPESFEPLEPLESPASPASLTPPQDVGEVLRAEVSEPAGVALVDSLSLDAEDSALGQWSPLPADSRETPAGEATELGEDPPLAAADSRGVEAVAPLLAPLGHLPIESASSVIEEVAARASPEEASILFEPETSGRSLEEEHELPGASTLGPLSSSASSAPAAEDTDLGPQLPFPIKTGGSGRKVREIEGDAATATLGEIYLRQGHTREAERIFEQVLRRSPRSEIAQLGLARIAERKKTFLAAESLLADVPDMGLTEKKILLLKNYLARLRHGEHGEQSDVS